MSDLGARMRTAANTIEEVSALYGYRFPNEAGWSASELRHEAQHATNVNPSGLYDVNCAGHTGGTDD
jgi:hypothetical protein